MARKTKAREILRLLEAGMSRSAIARAFRVETQRPGRRRGCRGAQGCLGGRGGDE